MTGHYMAPGVYVEEEPSAVQPIAGVSTSTAGFIGVVGATINVPAAITGETLEAVDGSPGEYTLPGLGDNEVVANEGSYEVRVNGAISAGATLNSGTGRAVLTETVESNAAVTASYVYKKQEEVTANQKQPVLCTSFADYTKRFGTFSVEDAGHRLLTHGVYGFFLNGGTRCYVMRFDSDTAIKDPGALTPFEAIDEIALVAAPGVTDSQVQQNLLDHCTTVGDRFAIIDSEVEITNGLTVANITRPGNNNYGAFYLPWIMVYDPAADLAKDEATDGGVFVGPSGHVAGVYARVDTTRGVHKAPANEVLRGVMQRTLKHPISKRVQDGLNPVGINCIRDMNGNIRVWGARTIGGDANGEWKYVNVRRLFLFLRESIDEGLQWTVFEPNDPNLWAKITRNVTAFLTSVWRSGALFGTTPQEAFYVKCDAEINPPEVRDQGRVITEIGVAVTKPAEFVIFRISQWAGPTG